MDLQLRAKHALVTGSTAGIGLAIATQLAREVASATVVGRTQVKVDLAVQSVRSQAPHSKVHGIVADVGTTEGCQGLIGQIASTDILVNNLGIYEPKQFTDISDEEWFRIFEVNVMSGVRLSRHYINGMMERNWGRIIFISSESGISTPPEMIHYGMTKSAQLAISRGLAETTRGTGVTVNSILPGPTRSEGIVEFLKQVNDKPNPTDEEAERDFFGKHRQASILQRLIEPEEIASLTAFIASPLSSATNGASLRAEGGLIRSIA